MFQEITLAGDIIKSYRERRSLYATALGLLGKERKIFIDKERFYKQIDSFLDSLPESEKADANSTVKVFLYGNVSPKVPENFPVTPGEVPDEDFRRLLSIANGNGDRILVKYRYDSEYQLTIALKTNVHVCSLYKYLNPGKTEHMANPRRVDFAHVEEFDPKPLLEPYLRISKSLWIQDAWPLYYSEKKKEWRPRPFMNDLFRMCRLGSIVTIHIHSLSDENRKESDQLSEELINAKLNQIKPPGISLNITFGKVHDRPWKTDQFNIDVGGGIKMFFKRGKVYENGSGENAYITITPRDV